MRGAGLVLAPVEPGMLVEASEEAAQLVAHVHPPGRAVRFGFDDGEAVSLCGLQGGHTARERVEGVPMVGEGEIGP